MELTYNELLLAYIEIKYKYGNMVKRIEYNPDDVELEKKLIKFRGLIKKTENWHFFGIQLIKNKDVKIGNVNIIYFDEQNELKLIDDITAAMEKRDNQTEEECKCLGSWLVNAGYRVSTCTHCGKIWHWHKTLDASGNWQYEREALNQKEENK